MGIIAATGQKLVLISPTQLVHVTMTQMEQDQRVAHVFVETMAHRTVQTIAEIV